MIRTEQARDMSHRSQELFFPEIDGGRRELTECNR